MFLNTRENHWVDVDTLENKYPRLFWACWGNDRLDKQFDENWRGAKSSNLIRAIIITVLENSLEQARSSWFLEEFTSGLDIERLPE
jgi:lysozyme